MTRNLDWRCSGSRRATRPRRSPSIDRSLQGAAFDGFARARMLAAQAEIARAADNRNERGRRGTSFGEIAGTAPVSRGASGERVGRRPARPLRWTTPRPPPGHLREARRALERRLRTLRGREGGGRDRRGRAPAGRHGGCHGTAPKKPAPRSRGWGRGWKRSGRPVGRNGSGAADRRPGSSGRSCSRTSSARPRCWE